MLKIINSIYNIALYLAAERFLHLKKCLFGFRPNLQMPLACLRFYFYMQQRMTTLDSKCVEITVIEKTSQIFLRDDRYSLKVPPLCLAPQHLHSYHKHLMGLCSLFGTISYLQPIFCYSYFNPNVAFIAIILSSISCTVHCSIFLKYLFKIAAPKLYCFSELSFIFQKYCLQVEAL